VLAAVPIDGVIEVASQSRRHKCWQIADSEADTLT
jgi:hypothetical protein